MARKLLVLNENSEMNVYRENEQVGILHLENDGSITLSIEHETGFWNIPLVKEMSQALDQLEKLFTTTD